MCLVNSRYSKKTNMTRKDCVRGRVVDEIREKIIGPIHIGLSVKNCGFYFSDMGNHYRVLNMCVVH